MCAWSRIFIQYVRYAHGKEHLSRSSLTFQQKYQCYLSKRACADGVDCNIIRTSWGRSLEHHTSPLSVTRALRLPPKKEADKSVTAWHKAPGMMSTVREQRAEERKKTEVYWRAIKYDAKAYAHVSIVTPGTAPMLRCCMWINGGLHWLHYGWNTGRNWAALSWVVAIAMAAQTHTFMGLLLLKHIVLSAATYTPMHACVCKCISARARTCTPALAGAFLHMCTHTCAHARVHMHTRT